MNSVPPAFSLCFSMIRQKSISEGFQLYIRALTQFKSTPSFPIIYKRTFINLLNLSADFLNQKEISMCEKLLINLERLINNENLFIHDFKVLLFNYIGCLFKRKNELFKARKCFEECLTIIKKENLKLHKGLTYVNITALEVQMRNFKEAYISAKKAVIEAESERDFLKNNPKSIKEEFHQTITVLAIAYYNLGKQEEIQNNTDIAHDCYTRASTLLNLYDPKSHLLKKIHPKLNQIILKTESKNSDIPYLIDLNFTKKPKKTKLKKKSHPSKPNILKYKTYLSVYQLKPTQINTIKNTFYLKKNLTTNKHAKTEQTLQSFNNSKAVPISLEIEDLTAKGLLDWDESGDSFSPEKIIKSPKTKDFLMNLQSFQKNLETRKNNFNLNTHTKIEKLDKSFLSSKTQSPKKKSTARKIDEKKEKMAMKIQRKVRKWLNKKVKPSKILLKQENFSIQKIINELSPYKKLNKRIIIGTLQISLYENKIYIIFKAKTPLKLYKHLISFQPLEYLSHVIFEEIAKQIPNEIQLITDYLIFAKEKPNIKLENFDLQLERIKEGQSLIKLYPIKEIYEKSEEINPVLDESQLFPLIYESDKEKICPILEKQWDLDPIKPILFEDPDFALKLEEKDFIDLITEGRFSGIRTITISEKKNANKKKKIKAKYSLKEKINNVIKIQAFWKGILLRKRFFGKNKTCILLQAIKRVNSQFYWIKIIKIQEIYQFILIKPSLLIINIDMILAESIIYSKNPFVWFNFTSNPLIKDLYKLENLNSLVILKTKQEYFCKKISFLLIKKLFLWSKKIHKLININESIKIKINKKSLKEFFFIIKRIFTQKKREIIALNNFMQIINKKIVLKFQFIMTKLKFILKKHQYLLNLLENSLKIHKKTSDYHKCSLGFYLLRTNYRLKDLWPVSRQNIYKGKRQLEALIYYDPIKFEIVVISDEPDISETKKHELVEGKKEEIIQKIREKTKFVTLDYIKGTLQMIFRWFSFKEGNSVLMIQKWIYKKIYKCTWEILFKKNKAFCYLHILEEKMNVILKNYPTFDRKIINIPQPLADYLLLLNKYLEIPILLGQYITFEENKKEIDIKINRKNWVFQIFQKKIRFNNQENSLFLSLQEEIDYTDGKIIIRLLNDPSKFFKMPLNLKDVNNSKENIKLVRDILLNTSIYQDSDNKIRLLNDSDSFSPLLTKHTYLNFNGLSIKFTHRLLELHKQFLLQIETFYSLYQSSINQYFISVSDINKFGLRNEKNTNITPFLCFDNILGLKFPFEFKFESIKNAEIINFTPPHQIKKLKNVQNQSPKKVKSPYSLNKNINHKKNILKNENGFLSPKKIQEEGFSFLSNRYEKSPKKKNQFDKIEKFENFEKATRIIQRFYRLKIKGNKNNEKKIIKLENAVKMLQRLFKNKRKKEDTPLGKDVLVGEKLLKFEENEYKIVILKDPEEILRNVIFLQCYFKFKTKKINNNFIRKIEIS